MSNTTSGPAIDPAIRAAATAKPAEAGPDAEAIDPLSKDGDALLASDPSNPLHGLYAQAMQGLELLGGQRFKDRRELERVALQIAIQASAIGLARIDRVAASDDGAGYFFVDQQAVDPAMRGHIAHAEAVRPATPQQLAEVQRQQQQRALDEQRYTGLAQQDTRQKDAQEAQRRGDPRQVREL